MNSNMERLEKRFVPEVILWIGEHPDRTRGEIIHAVSENKGYERTIYLRIEELLDAGIVEASGTKDAKGFTPGTITLTEYGRRIEAKLRELVEVVNG